MGADMIVAVCAIKRDVKPDFDAGREFVNKLDLTDEGLLANLIEQGLDNEEEAWDEKNQCWITEEVRKWVLQSLDEFSGIIFSRYATAVSVRDLEVFIAGGLSWGDSPEGCQAIWLMGRIEGLMTAMGFEEDYYKTETVVTPEEEAAAVESIKRVAGR